MLSRWGPRNWGHAPGRLAGWPSERVSLPERTGLAPPPDTESGAWSVPGIRRARGFPGCDIVQRAKARMPTKAKAVGTRKVGSDRFISSVSNYLSGPLMEVEGE